jgi:acyl transferase domain-containing protein
MQDASGGIGVRSTSCEWSSHTPYAAVQSLGLNGTCCHALLRMWRSDDVDEQSYSNNNNNNDDDKDECRVLLLRRESASMIEAVTKQWLEYVDALPRQRWSLGEALAAQARRVLHVLPRGELMAVWAGSARELRDQLARAARWHLVDVGGGVWCVQQQQQQQQQQASASDWNRLQRAALQTTLKRDRSNERLVPLPALLVPSRRVWPDLQTTAVQASSGMAARVARLCDRRLDATRELVHHMSLAPPPDYAATMLAFENAVIESFLRQTSLPTDFVGSEADAFAALGAHARYRKLWHVMVRNLLLEQRVVTRDDEQRSVAYELLS